ncbi:MAG TPA: hypothetical protein VGO80_22925 [Solirubrobacteraceae bacterium]|jgi:hypothetical protein|nr:hypothetical protein [Solirubrobacteraceae bacterium]
MSSITFWTRLEAFTRFDDIEAGLQARIHDPLWLLARQWQTGEFQGEDAGTPVQARVRLERGPLARFAPRAGSPGEPYRAELPLEALVEREPVQPPTDPRRDLRLAAETGLTFLRMLDRAGVTAPTRAAFAHEPDFALSGPADPDDLGARYLSVMSHRAPDGLRLYQAFVKAAGGLPPRPIVPAADIPKATAAAQTFRAWFEARYGTASSATADPPSWVAERMEYAFAVSAATDRGELVLSASEYPGGTLDWYSFDADGERILGIRSSDPRPEPVVRTVMPTPVRYPGIAADRWWQLEDARVNFSRIDGDPSELLRLMLVDFALLYSNDWFILPIDAAPGAVYRLRSLVVTDAFGQRTLVPHYSTAGADPTDWRMYAVSPYDDILFLPPALAGSIRSEPLEEVLFLRDELTNLVWAVEHLAPSIAGGPFDRDAANRRQAGETPTPSPAPPEPDSALRYRLATRVPDNWIPFQPIRIDPQQAAVRLRRAAALVDGGDEPRLSRPLGRILEPERPNLSLFEEEIPRAGARVTRHYQYARWVDGSTILWLGRHKTTGRGEGSSGLRFDTIDDA